MTEVKDRAVSVAASAALAGAEYVLDFTVLPWGSIAFAVGLAVAFAGLNLMTDIEAENLTLRKVLMVALQGGVAGFVAVLVAGALEWPPFAALACAVVAGLAGKPAIEAATSRLRNGIDGFKRGSEK